jgi:hypothetical protein
VERHPEDGQADDVVTRVSKEVERVGLQRRGPGSNARRQFN